MKTKNLVLKKGAWLLVQLSESSLESWLYSVLSFTALLREVIHQQIQSTMMVKTLTTHPERVLIKADLAILKEVLISVQLVKQALVRVQKR